ncbi:MAG TPA: hypothetical protein V6D17_14965 [Candidatus Obscuribacterales bacterium]
MREFIEPNGSQGGLSETNTNALMNVDEVSVSNCLLMRIARLPISSNCFVGNISSCYTGFSDWLVTSYAHVSARCFVTGRAACERAFVPVLFPAAMSAAVRQVNSRALARLAAVELQVMTNAHGSDDERQMLIKMGQK